MTLATSVEPLVLAGLAGVALLAGFVDSIAGGGGLLALPALLSAGLAPTEALATNKLQGSFGTAVASANYARGGAVRFADLRLEIVTVFLAAAAGTVLVQQVSTDGLERVLPVLLIGIAAWFWFSPSVGDVKRHELIRPRTFALTAAPAIGFYDGFIGPGTGSFFAAGFVSLSGMDLTSATAHTKVLNFTSNVASLTFFVIGGKPVWIVGGCMAVGQLIGARLGSGLVLRQGARVVRPLLVVVSLAMSVRLLLT